MDTHAPLDEFWAKEIVDEADCERAPGEEPEGGSAAADDKEEYDRRPYDERGANARNERRDSRRASPQRRLRNSKESEPYTRQYSLNNRDDKTSSHDRMYRHLQLS